MPVGLGLGRDHEPHYGRREGMVLMPYDPLWVGQLAGLHTLEGQDCGTGGRPTGYSLCKGSIPLGGSPRLLSVARALLPKRVFYLEGGGRKPGQWERARARVRHIWGYSWTFPSGTRRTGEGCGPFREKQACRFSVNILFVCLFVSCAEWSKRVFKSPARN